MYYGDLPCWCGGSPAFGIPHEPVADVSQAAADAAREEAWDDWQMNVILPVSTDWDVAHEAFCAGWEAAAPLIAAAERAKVQHAMDRVTHLAEAAQAKAAEHAVAAERERIRQLATERKAQLSVAEAIESAVDYWDGWIDCDGLAEVALKAVADLLEDSHEG